MRFLRLLVLAAFAVAVPSALAVRGRLRIAGHHPRRDRPALDPRALESRRPDLRRRCARADRHAREGDRCCGSGRRSTSAAATSAAPSRGARTAATSASSTGSPSGRTSLTAKLGSKTRITITNHPIGGPIFAGPQVQPWFCTTAENGLGPATDAQCNAPTTSHVQVPLLRHRASSPPTTRRARRSTSRRRRPTRA